MPLNLNSLHNLPDEELFQEIRRRYPDFVFAGMEPKGRIISPFNGSLVTCLGLTILAQATVKDFFVAKAENNKSLLTS